MSEKEDKEATTTQHLTQQQTDKHNHTSGPTTTKRVDQQQPHRLAQPTATTGPSPATTGPSPATTGPSPIPSPVGRGVITEIPLTSCHSLLTVLFAVVSYLVLHTLYLI